MTEKILHVSDSLIGAEQFAVNDEVPLGGFSTVVERAVEKKVDAVVHGGNLFRRPQPESDIVEAVASELETLAAEGIPFLIIEGRREAYTTGDPINVLEEQNLAQKLTSEPTIIGDVTFYGIDYVDTEEMLLDELEELTSTSSFTYNIIVTHQDIWPPLWKERADISAFDLLEGTDVHVGMVLAGGNDEPGDWQHDDYEYSVVYPGSTNPEKLSSVEVPQGTLIHADTEGSSYTHIPLDTADVYAELEHLRQTLKFQPSETEDLDTETLVDLYGLSARAKSVFEKRRKEIRDELLDRIDEDGRFEGHYASVDRRTNKRRTLKSEETVIKVLKREEIDPEEVMALDTSELRELVNEERLNEEEVFELSHYQMVRVDDVTL